MPYVKHKRRYVDGKKLCYKCDIYFDVSEFNICNRNPDKLTNECKTCCKKRNKIRYDSMSNEEYLRKIEDNKRFRNTNVKRSMMIHMLNGVKQRCKKSGKNYEVNREYIESKIEAGVCEATGIPFRYERNGRGSITPFGPSLDCINPEEGYTLSNTQMVCSMYNIGKGRHSETDFIAMCMAVAARNWGNEAAVSRLKELLNGE